jgi:phospholipase/carboxylesterase
MEVYGRFSSARNGKKPSFGTIGFLEKAGCFMPYPDLSWQTFRPAEGFYLSEVEKPRRLPVRTFLPTGYEPRYPYPLVVFFHGRGGNEEQILQLAPRLSRRNYICISLRGFDEHGPRADGKPGFCWGPQSLQDSAVEDYVFRAIELTRRSYHVHSERIYLAGISDGASLAYALGMQFPEKFGGVISLNGAMARSGGPLLRLPAARQLRVFIGHGIANAKTPLSMARQDCRLLYTAGLDVEMHTYPATNRLHPDMLRDLNRWMMNLCNEE